MAKTKVSTRTELAIPRDLVTEEQRSGGVVKYVKFHGTVDLEGVTLSAQDDAALQFPRIKLLQAMSKESQDDETVSAGAKVGTFWKCGLDEPLGDQLEFLPLLRFKDRLFFGPAPSRDLLCMSRDGAGTYGIPMTSDTAYNFNFIEADVDVDGVKSRQRVVACGSCQYSQWGSEGGVRRPPKCDPISVYIGMLKSDFQYVCDNVRDISESGDISALFGRLCILDFKSTSWKTGAQLMQRLILRGGAVFGSIATITAKKIVDKYTYYTAELGKMDLVTGEELFVARGLSRFAEQFRTAAHVELMSSARNELDDHNLDVTIEDSGVMRGKNIEV